jgi:predicted nucleotide-binding protein
VGNALYQSTLYKRAIFKSSTIINVERLLSENRVPDFAERAIKRGDTIVGFDTDAEFFSEYGRSFDSATYSKKYGPNRLSIAVNQSQEFPPGSLLHDSLITVVSDSRPAVLTSFNTFDQELENVQKPEPGAARKLSVFIGHGHNPAWRELKDHLQDQAGYHVVAYEIGARAGLEVRDILEQMLTGSNIAFLIMTKDDETATGGMRARQNVVHELGLFQGKLGFTRAIVVREIGVELFSNITGVQRIEYRENNIREAFGDVLATLRREEQLVTLNSRTP